MEKWLVRMRILAQKLCKNEAEFWSKPKPQIRNSDDPHGPDDPFRIINYHHLDISGHDGMDEQDIGWRNGWC
jgi:hypothetical protein